MLIRSVGGSVPQPWLVTRQRPIGAVDLGQIEDATGLSAYEADEAVSGFKLRKLGRKVVKAYSGAVKKVGKQAEAAGRRVATAIAQHPELLQAAAGVASGGLSELMGGGGFFGGMFPQLASQGSGGRHSFGPDEGSGGGAGPNYLPWVVAGGVGLLALVLLVK